MNKEVKRNMKKNVLYKMWKSGMTVQSLADKFGYSHNHVWKMVHGYSPVSKRVLAILRLK